jgi:hypothetical protein
LSLGLGSENLHQRRDDGGRVDVTVERKQIGGGSSKGTKQSVEWVYPFAGRVIMVSLRERRTSILIQY